MAINLAPGQAIRSKSNEWYKCVQHLGTGGNAVTFLVLSTSGINKGSLFALKVYQRVSDSGRLQKFLDEIQFLEKCNHPSIMRVYDSGEFATNGPSHPFVVMEYLPAHLRAEMRKGELDTSAKISLATQLISALAYLEQLAPKIIHRDIKPQNIFIKGKTCVLGDFGLMKVCSDILNDSEDRRNIKSYIGMPFYYRAPDLVSYAKNEAPISTASDVFQLGLVLAELFTGHNPCKVPKNILDPVKLDAIGSIPGRLGPRILRIIEKMLVVDHRKRESVRRLLDHWNGIFDVAVGMAHELNGKVF